MEPFQLHERLACYGTPTLSTEELLTLVLAPGSAHESEPESVYRLLTAYGGLRGIVRADFGELCSEHHLSRTEAAKLQAVLELAKRLATCVATESHPRITCPADAANLVMAEMMHLDFEQLRVLVLDTKHRVMANLVLYQGTVNAACVRVAELFKPVITRKGAGILVLHNHPTGLTDMSPEDKTLTLQLLEAGKLLDITVVDHIIIGNGRFLSLKEHMRWE